jgi:hypothetical protein
MDVVVDSVTQIWGQEPTQVVALDRFSHHFRSGRFSCLLGPSGCSAPFLAVIELRQGRLPSKTREYGRSLLRSFALGVRANAESTNGPVGAHTAHVIHVRTRLFAACEYYAFTGVTQLQSALSPCKLSAGAAVPSRN